MQKEPTFRLTITGQEAIDAAMPHIEKILLDFARDIQPNEVTFTLRSAEDIENFKREYPALTSSTFLVEETGNV